MAVDTLVGAGTGGYDTDGLVNESVLQTIYDLIKRPLDLQDMVGKGTHDREYHEWTMRRLAKGVTDNARVDGSDPSADDNKIGKRVGNHSQISAKTVKVSDRVRASNAVGTGDELRRQITDRAWELRYDMEATATSNEDSVADDGSSTAGMSAGLVAWAKHEDVDGTATSHVVSIGSGGTFADNGFNSGTNIVDGKTFNTSNAGLQQADIDGVILAMWKLNSKPTVAMMTGTVLQKLSKYFFTSGAQISTLTANGPDSAADRIAQSAVNVYHTDFGTTLRLVANPHMPNRVDTTMTDGTTDTDCMLIFDPSYIKFSTLKNFTTKNHAVTGLAQEVEHSVDWTLVLENHEALGCICGILDTTAVAA